MCATFRCGLDLGKEAGPGAQNGRFASGCTTKKFARLVEPTRRLSVADRARVSFLGSLCSVMLSTIGTALAEW